MSSRSSHKPQPEIGTLDKKGFLSIIAQQIQQQIQLQPQAANHTTTTTTTATPCLPANYHQIDTDINQSSAMAN